MNTLDDPNFNLNNLKKAKICNSKVRIINRWRLSKFKNFRSKKKDYLRRNQKES